MSFKRGGSHKSVHVFLQLLPLVILNTANGYKKPAFDDEADVGQRALKILDISAYGILSQANSSRGGSLAPVPLSTTATS
jgi:hypothetical protein